MLPAYLVASNCCLLIDSPDRGRHEEATARECCVDSQPAPGPPHRGYDSEPAARQPHDHDHSRSDPAAPCCNLAPNALLPGGASVAVGFGSASFDAVTPQIAAIPVLVELGLAATTSSESPPIRAARLRRSRAPPVA